MAPVEVIHSASDSVEVVAEQDAVVSTEHRHVVKLDNGIAKVQAE